MGGGPRFCLSPQNSLPLILALFFIYKSTFPFVYLYPRILQKFSLSILIYHIRKLKKCQTVLFIGVFLLIFLPFFRTFWPLVLPKEWFAQKNWVEVFSGRHYNLVVRQPPKIPQLFPNFESFGRILLCCLPNMPNNKPLAHPSGLPCLPSKI